MSGQPPSGDVPGDGMWCDPGDPRILFFRQVFTHYFAELIAVACKALGNMEDAEDIVALVEQQTLDMIVRGSFRDFNEDVIHKVLRRILRRRLLDFLEQQHREHRLIEYLRSEAREELRVSAPGALTTSSSAQKELLELLGRDYEILTLRYIDNLSYDEIAARLKLPGAGTARQRLRRAILVLADKLNTEPDALRQRLECLRILTHQKGRRSRGGCT